MKLNDMIKKYEISQAIYDINNGDQSDAYNDIFTAYIKDEDEPAPYELKTDAQIALKYLLELDNFDLSKKQLSILTGEKEKEYFTSMDFFERLKKQAKRLPESAQAIVAIDIIQVYSDSDGYYQRGYLTV